MAVAYGLYYVVRRPTYSSTWIYGIVFCFFYLVFLLWQTYYAILTARTSSWGTRPATAGPGAGAGGARGARALVIARLRSFLGRAGALALLPLSVVPMLLVGPSLVHSHSRFQRAHDSAPHAAPPVLFTPRRSRGTRAVAPFRGAVPVLVYHGINDDNDHYSVSREEFARQLAMLDLSGYRTITIDQYLRFRSGRHRRACPSARS